MVSLVVQDVDVNSRDANGWTALHYCAFVASQPHYTLAKALLEAGAGTFTKAYFLLITSPIWPCHDRLS
jgi:ankyrin repeat protein